MAHIPQSTNYSIIKISQSKTLFYFEFMMAQHANISEDNKNKLENNLKLDKAQSNYLVGLFSCFNVILAEFV